ncbi:hypothetical protein D9M69_659790 [compost metagenome]
MPKSGRFRWLGPSRVHPLAFGRAGQSMLATAASRRRTRNRRRLDLGRGVLFRPDQLDIKPYPRLHVLCHEIPPHVDDVLSCGIQAHALVIAFSGAAAHSELEYLLNGVMFDMGAYI